jgi:peroxiredoxin
MKGSNWAGALAAGLVAAAAVLGYWWWRAPPSTLIKVGDPAPELALQTIGTTATTRLSQFRGRPVLLTMFVDACPACAEVIGRLERLHRELGRHGLVVLGVATDLDPAARARYVKDFAITFFVLQDPGGLAIREAYGTTRLPELYLIDGAGTVQAVYLGRLAEREADLRDRVEKLLGRSKSG